MFLSPLGEAAHRVEGGLGRGRGDAMMKHGRLEAPPVRPREHGDEVDMLVNIMFAIVSATRLLRFFRQIDNPR